MMKLYNIIFCPWGHTVVEGPDNFDVRAEYKSWRKLILEKTGPEPNISCYGSHIKWLTEHVRVLKQYQEEYQCQGDFNVLFIEHLIRNHGFRRKEYHDVRLA